MSALGYDPNAAFPDVNATHGVPPSTPAPLSFLGAPAQPYVDPNGAPLPVDPFSAGGTHFVPAPAIAPAPVPVGPGVAPRPIDTGILPPHTVGAPVQGNLASFLNEPTDESHASNVIGHLMDALGRAKDPNLRESLSNALAALHKHVANFQKERQQALAGKLSPRLLAQAHQGGGAGNLAGANGGGPMIGGSPAQIQANAGNYSGAVQTWISHHPYAVAHGHIPGFVSQWELKANAPAAYTTAPAGTATAQ